MQWIKQHQLWSALIGIVSLIVLIGGVGLGTVPSL